MIELPVELTDNDFHYLSLLFSVVYFSAPESEVDVRRSRGDFNITVKPSNKLFRQDIVDNLLYIHRFLGIKIQFSSSLAISKLVQFRAIFEKNLVDSK